MSRAIFLLLLLAAAAAAHLLLPDLSATLGGGEALEEAVAALGHSLIV